MNIDCHCRFLSRAGFVLLAAVNFVFASAAFAQVPDLAGAPPEVTVSIGQAEGAIKPLLGVNCGPLAAGAPGNADLTGAYRKIGVRQVRTHDYYGPLDMATMYPDQNADPARPDSYNFAESDRVFAAILDGGFEPYLRLGDSWNNDPAFPKPKTRAPQNRANWVRAAVEVVRHYRRMAGAKLRYVEIWNEPDNRQFWDSNMREFFMLFDETARAIKKEFPGLKIGGPGYTPAAALAPQGRKKTADFLAFLRERKTPLDFFSWHIYANDPAAFESAARFFRSELDRHGFKSAGSHLTEYNTEDGRRDKSVTAAEMRLGGHGAAVITAAWIALQRAGVDEAAYYRGNDTALNFPTFYGLFRADGAPKRAALAFSFWASMASHPERLRVDAAGNDSNQLWLLAGRNSAGDAALLAANIGRQSLPLRIAPVAGRVMDGFTLEEISDSSPGVTRRQVKGDSTIIGGYTVQLITFKH